MEVWSLAEWETFARTVFYGTGTLLAVATYWKAKNGLLNTINTDYQKRVMDRLKELSERLYAEFDPDSPDYWPKERGIHWELKRIAKIFQRDRTDILAHGSWPYGVPAMKNTQRLRKILGPLESDPFVPEKIRKQVVQFLDDRLHVMEMVYFDTFERYLKKLAKGKQEPITNLDGLNQIHNSIVDQLSKQGCGVTDIEKDVHELRRAIQKYFESFTPRVWQWPGR